MSRNVGAMASVPRRGPQWSHLRQSSRASVDRTSTGSPASPRSESTQSTVGPNPRRKTEVICTVTVYDGYSKDEVLLNLDRVGVDVKPGTLMAIAVLKGDSGRASGGHGAATEKQSHDHNGSTEGETESLGHRYIFPAQDMPKEMKARQPDVEVYIVKQIADAFGMKKGSQVLLTLVSLSFPRACCFAN